MSFLSCLLATLALCAGIRKDAERLLDFTLEEATGTLQQSLKSGFKERRLAMERQASRWVVRGPQGTPEREWRADARRYLRDFPGFQTISWLDPTAHIRWVEPQRGNEAAVNFDASKDVIRRQGLKRAVAQRRPTFTSTVRFPQGGQGVVLLTPLLRQGRLLGYLGSSYRLDASFAALLPADILRNFRVRIREGEAVIFHSGPADDARTVWTGEQAVVQDGLVWMVSTSPTDSTLDDLSSPVPGITLAIGGLLSCLLGWAVFSALQTRRQSGELGHANAALLREALVRGRAEEELRAAGARLTTVVDHVGAALVLFGPETRVVLCNRLFCELFCPGQSTSSLVGLHQSELFLRLVTQVSNASARLEAPPATQEGRRELSTGDGRHLEWVWLPVTGAGHLWLFRDVTAERTLQSELSQARDAALESARLKAEFLATMSHEIRTPMNGVIGMTHLLLESPLTSEQLEHARTLQSCGESLLGVIDDILDFSKIEAGKLYIQISPLELRPFVLDTLRPFSELSRSKGVELSWNVVEALPDTIRADAARLRQVLNNLLSNALKFTSRGSVDLNVTRVDEHTVRFAVRDTGIGIAPDTARRLFQPFSQADGSVTRRYGGTGLGLAICKQLTELMGGEIGLISTVDTGSIFWFTLPLLQAAPARPAGSGPPGAHAPLPAGRLLVVEDNLVNQKVAVKQLQRLGFHTEVAANGELALDMLAQQSFDLVLLDCHMPVMDGFTAATEMRRRGLELPVVALTAGATEGEREQCLQAGTNDFLAKPLRLEELERVLRRWLLPHS